jgi:hypothetical protein
MNKASAVMVASTGIVDRPLGRTIAQAVAKVIEDGARPGAERSAAPCCMDEQFDNRSWVA